MNKKQKTESFYEIKKQSSLSEDLLIIDQFNKEIHAQQKQYPEFWTTIQDKLKVDWTYNSNAIEGSPLTRGETLFFLQEGLTVEGKPLKDFLDAQNHAEAIDFLFEIIKNNRKITKGVIKELNALLLNGISNTKAQNQFGQIIKKTAIPGHYKKLPNHVQQADGTIHYYTEPIFVTDEMAYLIQWINNTIDKQHPVIRAIAHYNLVRIHPFDDGNGRGARLLMNLILLKKGYSIAVIRNKNRRDYIDNLIKADNGELVTFINYIAKSLKETQEIILADTKEYKLHL